MKRCELLIKNTTALVNSEIIQEKVDIAIQNGMILEVGEGLAKEYQSEETIDGKGSGDGSK